MYTKQITLKVTDQGKKFAERMLVVGLIGGFIAALIVCSIFMVIMGASHKAEIAMYEEAIGEIEAEYLGYIDECEAKYADLVGRYNKMFTDHISEKETLEAQIKSLQDRIDEENQYDFGLMKEYWYVIKEAPLKGGVEFELIQHVENLCKEKDINPHLVWAMIDVESDYIANIDNAVSSARGLGQFLKSTAELFYSKAQFMNRGTYDHKYAYDPYINTEMMVWYLEYLRDSYNEDLLTMMQRYSGDTGGTTYYNKVIAELNQYDHDAYIRYQDYK